MWNQSVLISGAGIAGPTLAFWLAEYGFRPTLVERAPHIRQGGYLIDFWGLGYDIADKMGLFPELEHRAYQVKELRYVDGRGSRVGGFGVDIFRKMTKGRYITLPRSELGEAISRAVENRCEFVFDDSIVKIENTRDHVNVKFENAPSRKFDLLVAADGLHSNVRQLVFGAESKFEEYLGYAVAAFESKHYRPRDELVYVSYGVPGKSVGRFALRDDRTLFLLVFRAPRLHPTEWSETQTQKATLHREFDGAKWECPEILVALDQAEHLYFDKVSQIHMDRWSRGRVVLIGDAAFAPSLLAGQGSALAMTAAYILAGELANSEGRYQRAFQRYEQLLREFIDSKQKAAERFAGSFAPKTPLGLFIRNQLSKGLRFPSVAKVLIGRGLLDRLALPTYPSVTIPAGAQGQQAVN
jgi:2-polyprenyl-6-methoxyphenol hydroxylase-like FAD-dependent oxidoreductase